VFQHVHVLLVVVLVVSPAMLRSNFFYDLVCKTLKLRLRFRVVDEFLLFFLFLFLWTLSEKFVLQIIVSLYALTPSVSVRIGL